MMVGNTIVKPKGGEIVGLTKGIPTPSDGSIPQLNLTEGCLGDLGS